MKFASSLHHFPHHCPSCRLCRLGHALLTAVFMLGLIACGDDHPQGIPRPNEMEQIIYDYQMAMALGAQSEAQNQTKSAERRYNTHYYIRSALARHGMTQVEFDSAMAWYSRHPMKLVEIYRQIDKKKAGGDGWTASAIQDAPNATRVDLWQGSRRLLLFSPLQRQQGFTLNVDTLLRPADRLEWKLDANWKQGEGQREAVMLMAVYYEGDSVRTVSQPVRGNGNQRLSITIDSLAVKQVRLWCALINARASVSHKLVISDMRLDRVRKKDADERSDDVKTKAASDTLRRDSVVYSAPQSNAQDAQQKPAASQERLMFKPQQVQHRLRDSLLQEDTRNKQRSHFK